LVLTNGKGADGAIDCIGGAAGTHLSSCLRRGAVYLSLGLLSGLPVDWGYIHRTAEVKGKLFHLRHWNEASSLEQWHQAFQHIITMLAMKQLVLPTPSACFALTEVNTAVEYFETEKQQRGKILLTSR
jgi:NADPH:quinone reductase-like Zn-dependent oxidoreductase